MMPNVNIRMTIRNQFSLMFACKDCQCVFYAVCPLAFNVYSKRKKQFRCINSRKGSLMPCKCAARVKRKGVDQPCPFCWHVLHPFLPFYFFFALIIRTSSMFPTFKISKEIDKNKHLEKAIFWFSSARWKKSRPPICQQYIVYYSR